MSGRPGTLQSGCLLLTSRAVWNRLGGLDERFFMYGEDLDLSIRAAGLGCRPMITPDAVITHVLGGSSSGVSRRVLTLRGKVTAIRKHWTPWRAGLGVTLLVVGTAARGYGAHAVHRLSGGRRGMEALVWRTVFDDRRAWSTPFPAAVDGLEGPTAPEELRLPPNSPLAVAGDPAENGATPCGDSSLA